MKFDAEKDAATHAKQQDSKTGFWGDSWKVSRDTGAMRSGARGGAGEAGTEGLGERGVDVRYGWGTGGGTAGGALGRGGE